MNRLGTRLLLAMLAVTLLSLAVAPLAQFVAARITFAPLPEGFRERVAERTDPPPWFRPPRSELEGGERQRFAEEPGVTIDAAIDADLPTPAGLRAENERLLSLFGTFRATLQRTLWVGTAIAVLICVLLAWWVSRSVARPLEAVSAGASRVARGDLGARVELAPGGRQPRETRELAAGFNAMAEALERYEGQRRAMIADIAHELRTPLASLGMRLEALEDGLVAFDENEAAGLRNHVDLLERLIGDLRILSLADEGRLSLDLQTLDLGAWLRQTEPAHRDTVHRRGAELHLETVPEALWVRADPLRLQQVLHNLLDNAGKATPDGERVDLVLERRGREALLRVRDRGPGLTADELRSVFERFVRGERRDTRDAKGSGLGLAIAQTLTILQGGRIGARNRTDGGAEFEVALPSYASHGAAGAPETDPRRAS